MRCSMLAVRDTGIDGVADDIEAAAVVSQDESEARDKSGSGALSVVINGVMSLRT